MSAPNSKFSTSGHYSLPISIGRLGAMNEQEDRIVTTATLKELARTHGFTSMSISKAVPVESDAKIASDRIAEGKFSGLSWFTEQRMQVAGDPEKLLTGAQSVLTFAINYFDWDSESIRSQTRGQIARYAIGRDYHRVLKRRLLAYMKNVVEVIGGSETYRIFVDDAPLLERAFGRASGLGWIGKNTNLLVPGNGSWVFLAEVITSIDLVPDIPVQKSCGTCERCIDICPTNAITAAYEVENDRCISFLTIENRGPIPTELRNLMGTWIFGCDLCQEICPVNRMAGEIAFDEFRMRKELDQFDMREILRMTEDAFEDRFKGSAIMRAKYVGMQRNVCVALGNIGSADDEGLLKETLGNPSALVRGHAVWALSQIGTPSAMDALVLLTSTEQDPTVIAELESVLRN